MKENTGHIHSIRSSVIDAYFPEKLPDINNLLKTGKDGRVAIEVMTHLDNSVVRGISLHPPQGLARGDRVIDPGRRHEW